MLISDFNNFRWYRVKTPTRAVLYKNICCSFLALNLTGFSSLIRLKEPFNWFLETTSHAYHSQLKQTLWAKAISSLTQSIRRITLFWHGT